MEKYIQIKDFENYEVSNLGNVRNIKTGRLIKQRRNRSYLILGLHKNGIKYRQSVHRLVAIAHVENPNGFPEVDHIDRNSLNNNSTNLRWVTRKMNIENSIYSRIPLITYNTIRSTYLVYNPLARQYEEYKSIDDAVLHFQSLII